MRTPREMGGADVWEMIAAGLTVALLAGLATLAYQRPEEYSVLSKVLLLFLWLIGFSVGLFLLGALTSQVRILARTVAMRPDGPISAIADQVESMRALVGWVRDIGLALLVFTLYAYGLTYLGPIRTAALNADEAGSEKPGSPLE